MSPPPPPSQRQSHLVLIGEHGLSICASFFVVLNERHRSRFQRIEEAFKGKPSYTGGQLGWTLIVFAHQVGFAASFVPPTAFFSRCAVTWCHGVGIVASSTELHSDLIVHRITCRQTTCLLQRCKGTLSVTVLYKVKTTPATIIRFVAHCAVNPRENS